MQLDPHTRNVFIVVAGTVVVLVGIGIVFSGRPSDAIYTGPPVLTEPAQPAEEAAPDQVADTDAAAEEAPVEAPAEAVTEEVTEQAAAEEAGVAQVSAEEALAEMAPDAEAPVEEAPVEDEAPAEAVPAEEAAAEEAPAEETAAVAVAGDPEAGARVFRQCQACHQIGEGAQNRVGPHLTGIIDREAAAVEGFNYSAAMEARADEGLVWNEENLRAYLADPRGFMPGTSMTFAGVRSEDDLTNLIAYMATYE